MQWMYRIELDGKEVTEEYGFDSESEAESEGGFAIDTYADCYDRRWSEFRLMVRSY